MEKRLCVGAYYVGTGVGWIAQGLVDWGVRPRFHSAWSLQENIIRIRAIAHLMIARMDDG